MINDIITRCPVCSQKLEVIKVSCSHCDTSCEGRFALDKFSYLTEDEKYFIEVFLRCRGNIKDVEKQLGISYPTVRNKLDGIVQNLGGAIDTSKNKNINKDEILSMVEKGEITIDEAIKKLNK